MFPSFRHDARPWLEWARLVLQLSVFGGKRHDWMPDAAKGLILSIDVIGLRMMMTRAASSIRSDWADVPAKRNKLWWTAHRGAGAAHYLNEHVPSDFHEESYRKIWGTIGHFFIDHKNGGWHEELTEDQFPPTRFSLAGATFITPCRPASSLIFPATGSLTKVIAEAGGNLQRKALASALSVTPAIDLYDRAEIVQFVAKRERPASTTRLWSSLCGSPDTVTAPMQPVR